MPRHVEREDAPVSRDRIVGHEVAELPPVRARGVKADERPALARFLEVHAVGLPAGGDVSVAPRDRLEHVRQPRAPA